MNIVDIYGEPFQKVKDWERHIHKNEKGEVGRVYFLNIKLTFPNGKYMTKGSPFTLNPDHGSTVEKMLRKSKEIPRHMKKDLLDNRFSDARLSNGSVLSLWISTEEAPDNFK